LPEGGDRIVQTILKPLDDSTAEFQFASTDSGNASDAWQIHMVGVARNGESARIFRSVPFELDRVKQRCAGSIPIDRYYESLRALGLEYGASFRAIEVLQRGDGEVLTRVRLPSHLANDHQLALHPALLDACLHLYPALIDTYGDFTKVVNEPQGVHLPVGVERFHCAGLRSREVWVHGVLRQKGNGGSESPMVDIAIFGDDGGLAAAIEGLSLKLLPPEVLRTHVAAGAGTSRNRMRASPGTTANLPAIRLQLREGSVANRRELLVGFVRQQAMKTLGITETIDTARPLREFGLDSLMSVTLVNRLEAALGIKISTVKLIKGPSIEQLVDEILPEAIGTGGGTAPITLEPGAGADLPPTKISSWAEHAASQPPVGGQADLSVESWPLSPDLQIGDEERPPPVSIVPNRGASDWLVVVGPRAAPQLRLFCFPFAGGGSAIYRNWAQFIDPAIEVIAIEPPGRLARINETPITDMDQFVDQLLPEMGAMLDRPFAFFGHCLGALTMYETTRRLLHTTMVRPEHLFVSGARPPDRISDHGLFEERLMYDLLKLAEFRIGLPAYAQPEDVFAELIRHFNIQATEQLLSDADLRKLMLPVIRAEFKMATNYQFGRETPWEIPITCFAAKGDPYVSRKHALGWGRFTNSRLQLHIREGAHFAVVDDMAFIHGVINRELHSTVTLETNNQAEW
jgi:surfactin synthase thioesterase subunit/acyl carrier protein